MYDHHAPLHIEKKKIIITEETEVGLPIKSPVYIKAFKDESILSLPPYSDNQKSVEVSVCGKHLYLPHTEVYDAESFIRIKIHDKKSVERVELEYFDPIRSITKEFILDRDSIISFDPILSFIEYDSDGICVDNKSTHINMNSKYVKIFINGEKWSDPYGLFCKFEKGTCIKYEINNTFDVSAKNGLICRTGCININIE